jgi:ketosteroid isomerase-like protein
VVRFFPTTFTILVSVISVAHSASSYAQEADVKAAIAAYHAALESLDMSKMEPLSAHDASVILINPPDKSISVGWDAAKKNWEGTFNFYSELKITQVAGPYVSVKGDVAWSTGIVHGVWKSKGGSGEGGVFETDVFEKRGGHWLLVSHSARPIPD